MRLLCAFISCRGKKRIINRNVSVKHLDTFQKKAQGVGVILSFRLVQPTPVTRSRPLAGYWTFPVRPLLMTIPFTRERSKVRSLVRPPAPSTKIKHVRNCDLSAMADQHAGRWLNHRLLVSSLAPVGNPPCKNQHPAKLGVLAS